MSKKAKYGAIIEIAAKAANLQKNSLKSEDEALFVPFLIEAITECKPDQAEALYSALKEIGGIANSAMRQGLCRIVWGEEPSEKESISDEAKRRAREEMRQAIEQEKARQAAKAAEAKS